MHSVVVCPPPLRLPRCLAAPSPPVSLSRLLVTSPPCLLGSSTPASSCTGCVALLLSVCTAACAVGDAVSPAALCLAKTAWSPFPVRSLGVCPGVLRIPLRYLLPPSSSSSFSFFFTLLPENWLGKAVVRPIIFLLVSPDPRTHPPRRSVGSSSMTARVQFRPGGGRIRPWVSARSDTEKQFRPGDGRNRHWVSARSDTSKQFRSGGGRIRHWVSARSDT